ncbi:hypothetical protein JOF48_003718 [Arthrobacter stackebrandtii]|uniref:DUF222 domain-containing protein n=1 Tax=Arthrobacter stackebrandtii TaxID=272161 RepID=A0ABS4Z1S4_9MICC|nr:HNH endonuclease signature motif containing protein [Arthrobacter stackebrandtii]MBP2414919.1 hypothetical protein [Arthrobacter stackebrandtii]PYH00914.1 hypothetical protein CVV67_08165 [Arthrobacter stackebrandtii]
MSIPEQFPEDRGDDAPATPRGVAGLLAGIALPVVEPFGAGSAALAGLPDYPPVSAVGPEPPSRNGVAYGVHCAGIDALEELRAHQGKVDAFRVRLIARVHGAAEVEWRAAKLDSFQRRVSGASIVTELAMALCIPERTAASLDQNACTLVEEYPSVLAGMEAGTFAYGHAAVMLNECRTLEVTAGVTPELVAAFLAKLLKLVIGTTVASFKGKARRARERMCPESLETRTKEAWARRSVSCEPGPDGMSWLTLYLPTLSATAIYTYCTRLARAIKYDAATSDRLNKARHPGTTEDLREHRTLDQLRADIATLLLLHQDPTHPADNTGNPADNTTAAQGAGEPGNPAHGAPDSGPNRDGASAGEGGDTGWKGFGPDAGSQPAEDDSGGWAWPTTPDTGPNRGGSRPGSGSAAGNGDTRPPGGGTPAPSDHGDTLSATASGSGGGGDGGGGVDDEPPWAHHDPATAPANPPGNPQDPDVRDGCRPDGRGPALQDTPPDTPHTPDIPAVAGAHDDSGSDVLEGIILPEGVSFMTGQDFMDEVVGDGSGYTPNGLVDGITEEEPWQEYREQLERLQHGKTMTDPPAPQGLFILTVPILSLFGLTNEPAEIAGPQGGLLPASIARELTARAPSLLRILNDPVTGDALPLHPQRYTLNKTEKAALRALRSGCYVPNCTNPVMETDLDHLRAFEFGGASTIANLAPACETHHRMRHLKDDKNKNGQRRTINEPERQHITLRGWTPQPTPDGRVGWITPTGRYQPPTPTDPTRPEYPQWLQHLITETTTTQRK